MSHLPRVAVIGCGLWGRNHVRTLAEQGALGGVCDRHPDRAAEFAAAHGTRAIALDGLLADDSIDAVVLALPAEENRTMTETMLLAGKHVLVEKPIALTSADAGAMAQAADHAGKVLMVGHVLRYHAAFAAVERLIHEGCIGAVRHIQSHRLGFGKFFAHFDALWDLGPHDLSLVLSLTGTAPSDVTGYPVSVTDGQTDAAHIHMVFEDGCTAHIHVGRHSPYPERRFVVTGETGMIVWDDLMDWPHKVTLTPHHVVRNDVGRWDAALGAAEAVPVAPNMALTDELNHFLECVQNGTMPRTPASQGLAVVDVIERAGGVR